MMAKTRHYFIAIQIVLFLFILKGTALCLIDMENGWQSNDIESAGSTYFKRSGGDPYFIFPERTEPVNIISGVRFVIRFAPMITKPFLAELFWKPENGGFSEENKVFFILQPGDGDTLDFVVPIQRDVGYNQIRFDLPRDLNVSFTVEKFEIVPLLNSRNSNSQHIEAYSMLSSSEAEELDILLPYILHTLQHGIKRLVRDPIFCLFWLTLILVTLFGIRNVTRKIEKTK